MYKCKQCGRDLKNDFIAILSKYQVCKKCVDKNHKKVTGK